MTTQVSTTAVSSSIPTVSERKKSLLCHSSPDKTKEKSNPLLNNFSIKPIIQFFNKKLKKDSKQKGSLKVERRRKMVVEKDYHSDTYVVDTSNDHSEEDSADCSRGRNLENKVYDDNKNKRASLYSDFGDLDLTFVVDEECYFRDKDEDINFESDTDSNNDDSGNYDLFNNYDDKEHEEEIFQELLAEVESNTLPITAAPTVENDDLSQDGDFCDTADEEEETESDVLVSFQEVKISEKALNLDKMTEFSTESEYHETAIAKDETNAVQAREILGESTLTAGAATETEYEEHSDISEQKESLPSQKANMVNLQSDSISELSEQLNNKAEECLTAGAAFADDVNDIKQVSTFVNAKDDDVTTEKITDAKCKIDSLPENDDGLVVQDIDNITKELTIVEDAHININTEEPVLTVTESGQSSSIETPEEIFDSQNRQNNSEHRETSGETVNVNIENISQPTTAEPEAVESINHFDDQKIVIEKEVEESLDRCNKNDNTAPGDSDANAAVEKEIVIDSQQVESQSSIQDDFKQSLSATVTSAGLAEPRGDAGEIEFNIKTDNLEADSEEPSNLVPTNSCSENPVDDVLSENQILENNIEDGGEIVGTNDPAMMQEFENQHETETMENVNINGSTENELINDNDMIHSDSNPSFQNQIVDGLKIDDSSRETIQFTSNSTDENDLQIETRGVECEMEGFHNETNILSFQSCTGENQYESINERGDTSSTDSISSKLIPGNPDCRNDKDEHINSNNNTLNKKNSNNIFHHQIPLSEMLNDKGMNVDTNSDMFDPSQHIDVLCEQQEFTSEDLNNFESDAVSELDTMSEYNSPFNSKHSRIPRITRSNSLMSFKRRCSLQSLPHHSSRRSSISSRRSSTVSIDERPPWNYGAGGTQYQKLLYPFGKRKRLSVDNYYD